MKTSVALAAILLSGGSAAASSFLVLPDNTRSISASMIALGKAEAKTEKSAETPKAADPGVDGVNVSSTEPDAAPEADAPAKAVRQVGSFGPMVFRGGLKGSAFAQGGTTATRTAPVSTEAAAAPAETPVEASTPATPPAPARPLSDVR